MWAIDTKNKLLERKLEVASMTNFKPQNGKNLFKLSY